WRCPVCSARPAYPAWATRPACLLEIRRRQIEIAHLDNLERVEAEAAELRNERCRVADEHDRQSIGAQIEPRDALYFVGRDRVDALAERLQLFDRQAVEEHVEHLGRDRVGRFNRQRETAGHVVLGFAKLTLADAVALQSPEL